MTDIPTTPALPAFDIPKGWNALYESNTKKVYVLKEFPLGGKANSYLTLLTKATEAELRAEITALGLTIVEPVAAVAPGAPTA
jgi:hypothetical protein